MEAQFDLHCSINIWKYLVSTENVFIITTFLNFMDPQELQAISDVALSTKRSQKFYRIAVAKMFVSNYLNRVDRSIFFLFYQQPQFQSIQKNTINALACNNYQFLEQSYHSFQTILQEIKLKTNFLQQPQQLLNLIQNIFFQPDIPMPKMKRQTIGMYCETAFQQFLSLKKFQEENQETEQWIDEALQQLKERFEHEAAIGIHLNSQSFQNLIETVRYRGWLVDSHHWPNYIITDFHSHNLLVLLLALSSQLVQTYFIFLQNIHDPFMRFVEFNLRADIFRNIVLTIEQRFSFLIKNYNFIFNNIYHPPPTIPKFNFWRPALSIWAQKMSYYHQENQKIYNYITTKLRENSLLKYLSTKTERLPSVYSELRDEAELNGFSEVLKDQAYAQCQGNLEIESFFDNNQEMYEVLAKDYLQYSVDMSVNEISIHWCGHSQHAIENHPIFQQISQNFIQSSLNYFTHLRSLIISAIPIDLQILTFRQILKEDLSFIGLSMAKPLTIRKLCNIVNELIKQFIKLLDKSNIFEEKIFTQYKILIDFQEKDNLLLYFAEKAEIQKNCIPSMNFFYCVQTKANSETPKVTIEEESDHSEEEHQIYESENQSN